MEQVRFAVVGVIGLMAITQNWVGAHRPHPNELADAVSYRVTSSGDHGPGTLREAILSADRDPDHARISVLVKRITLSAPLPPLINPNGITIDSEAGPSSIDASQVATGPVLEVRSKRSAINGLRIENGQHQGIAVVTLGLRISNTTIANCNIGVEVAEGAGDLLLERSGFEKNRIGIEADTFERGITVDKCKFFSQAQAGIWAVAQGIGGLAATLDVTRCQFSDNRFGIVASNHKIRIHDNDVALSHEAGVQLFNEGAVVEHNRIADGMGAGVQADSTSGVVIADNEILRNKTVAIVIKNSAGGLIRHNSIYLNGNGIAFVYGKTGSPNTATQNGIFSQTGDGIVTVESQPVLKDNSIRSNNTSGGTPQASLNSPPGASLTASLRPLREVRQ